MTTIDPPSLLETDFVDPECDNCGMIDVPLSDGYCAGCICLRCKKNAGELGQSMTDMGFCEKCEAEIYL